MNDEHGPSALCHGRGDDNRRNMVAVVVSDAFINDVFELERDICERVSGLSAEQTLAHIRQMANATDSSWLLLRHFLPKFRDPKILEVGAGYGLGFCGLLSRGLDAFAVEPGREPFDGRYHMAMRLLNDNDLDPARLRRGVAEALPFPNDTFDVVYSNAVLEHVQDPLKAMDEMARVLKPGGVMLTHVPNYHSFYEGHYRVLWFPYILKSKYVAKAYVDRVHGRDPAFVDTLNFVDTRWFQIWAKGRGTTLHKLPVLPVLGRVNRAISMAEHQIAPEGSLASWLQRRDPLARGILSASCRVATSVVLSLGLAKEIIVVWWKADQQKPH